MEEQPSNQEVQQQESAPAVSARPLPFPEAETTTAPMAMVEVHGAAKFTDDALWTGHIIGGTAVLLGLLCVFLAKSAYIHLEE